MKEKNVNFGKKKSVLYLIFSFLSVILISFVVLFIIEKEIRGAQFVELRTNEERILKLEKDFLGKELGMIISDLNYISNAFGENLEDELNYDDISNNWAEFSTNKFIYDQIRYIDKFGDEKIRINLDENKSYIVSKNKLQNKSDRYYFLETINLKKDSIYVSKIDLNIENNRIEEPYKPMIRFSTPVYSESGELMGIIVLNYLAENILESFKELALNSAGEVMLLNAEGYWLSNEDSSIEWGFMFEEKQEMTFKNSYENEWKNIKKENGQHLTENGLFTYVSIDLQNKMVTNNPSIKNKDLISKDSKWYIVSIVNRIGKNKSIFIDNNIDLVKDVCIKNLVYFLLVFLIAGIVGFLVYLNRETYSRIKYYSEFDALTKIYNRRAGIAKLNDLIPVDERRYFEMSLCFIDVNGLKQVNDSLGHKMGDELIITVVNVIKQVIRDSDFIVRMGGDEFLIVFNGIGTEEAENVWRRITERYNEINDTQNRPYLISVSHGIVSNNNKEKSRVDELIKTADEKMYIEKRIMKEDLEIIK